MVVTRLPDYLWGIETGILLLVRTELELGFQTTYEELKLELRWYHHAVEIAASRLPMRNWNAHRLSFEPFVFASRLPMRNWNGRAPAWLRHRSYQLPDYLWGIETRFPRPRAWGLQTLPDYLWGIETRSPAHTMPWEFSRFQTTYEELKHTKVNNAVASIPLPDYLWGIETFKMSMIFEAGSASRLPMRNWNFSGRTGRRRLRLPDYLWGIETFSFSRPHLLNEASRLPMRNWNYSSPWTVSNGFCIASRLPMRNWNFFRALRHGTWLRFQTTYEELKLEFFENISPIVKLPDYLWGIETPARRRRAMPFLPLPDYLWGIETFDAAKKARELVELPDYLWGIETFLRFNGKYHRVLASRLPMRNWNPVLPPLWSLCVSASRLPMRNWNRALSLSPVLTQVSLPDYLWGIETSTRYVSPIQSRFQTTYEELKPVIRFTEGYFDGKLPDYLWGIETRPYISPSIYSDSFQTTYEELKLVCPLHLASNPCEASRLPMRNWNEMMIQIKCLPLVASRLPMRNWNISAGSFPIDVAASRLPMRNWNIV